MSKRLTSLLVGALTVVLFGVPAQAQEFAKATASSRELPAFIQQLHKHCSSKPDFKMLNEQQREEAIVFMEKRHAGEGVLPLNAISHHSTPVAVRGSRGSVNSVLSLPASTNQVKNQRLTAPAKAETVTNGVITEPDAGQISYYTRSGWSYMVYNSTMYYANSEGYLKMVETADGTVYVQNIASYFPQGAWVKGTKSGNTITFASGQGQYYYDSYDVLYYMAWGVWDNAAGDFVKDDSKTEFTYTIDGDKVTLNGTDEDHILGVFYDYSGNTYFSGAGEYESVWTLDPDYGPNATLIQAPADMQTETWYSSGSVYSSGSSQNFTGTVTVGFSGNDVYLKGVFEAFPDSWIKGTIDGSTVTFKGLQYVGDAYGYNIFGIGTNGYLLDNFVMTYDAENQTLESKNELLANADDARMYYLEYIEELNLTKEAPGEAVAPTGDPIYELPYSNGFDVETEEYSVFGVIDSNADGKIWGITSAGEARYSYGVADADDWLISPAIYLEAGKNYHFAFDTRAQSARYPERIEVKMGLEAKASALTLPVIPATDVNWTEYVTLENFALTVSETGLYHFGIHAISDGDMYYLYADNFLIEAAALPTAPAAVTDFTVTSFEGDEIGANVSFTAPTKTVGGSDLTEITKIELLRDKAVIATFENVAPGAKVEYVDQAEDLTLGVHNYQVIPYNADGAGQKSDVLSVFLRIARFNVPFVVDLTDANIFQLFTVIDANEDGYTWASDANGACYSYTSAMSGDDYLISLPMTLQGGKSYSVKVNAICASATYPERFEVLVGKEPTVAGLNITAIGPTDVLNAEGYEEYEGEFTADADGVYYVAIHGISDADMYRLYIASLAVEAGASPTSPAAPRLAVQPDPYGAEKAVVTVTAPMRSINGQKLTENLSKLEIYRDGELIKSYENVEPSGIKVFVDKVGDTGFHTYQAVPYGADGRGRKSERVKAFIGLDVPNVVENVTAYEQEDGVLLTWKPVTTGYNGGTIVPNEVEYQVCTGHYETYLFWEFLYLDDVLVTTSDTEAFIPYDQSGEQTVETLFIIASNEAGRLDDDYATPANFFVGAPYELPIEDRFTGNTLAYNYLLDYSYWGGAQWFEDASDGDGSAIAFYAEDDEQWATFTLGKVAMEPGNITFLMDVMGDGSTANSVRLNVTTPEGKQFILGNFTPTDEYQTMKVSLADFMNYDFIKLTIYFDFQEAGYIAIDNIRILDLLSNNLAVSVAAPKTVNAGKAANVNVKVKNIGEEAVKDFTVKLFAGDQQLLSEKVTDQLASFEGLQFDAEFVTTIFDETEDVTLSAQVEYDLDLDDEDNVAETIITVKESTAAAPENVVAEKTASGVKLSWTAPGDTNEEVTEDFENQEVFEPWSLGGVSAESRYGAFGDWTLYDGNNMTVYGFSGMSFPNNNEIQAWQVANPAAIGAEGTYAPHSGDQFLWSFCPVDENNNTPDADHWLISPELTGKAQTISFFARQVSSLDETSSSFYGYEKFEIWVSTTDTKIESFTKVDASTISEADWAQFSYSLPEGAKFFAIRHISKDIFGLLVDDITFTRGGGSVEKYNYYVDRELAGSTTQTSVELPGVSASSVFAVSAVYSSGKESKPVSVIISGANQEITAIEQITGNSEPVDVYSLDGRLVRQQATDLRGLKGAFIIEGQKVIVK